MLAQVLQEVAAARQVLMTCGSSEINGHAFCSGLSLMKGFYENYPETVRLIQPVLYLLQDAIFRSRNGLISTATLRPLCELIDTYFSHGSTERYDKIYALLGLTSDDVIAAGIVPDYEITWASLLERLVKFFLHEDVSVSTWNDKTLAVIESNSYLLGKIKSVRDAGKGRVRVCVEPFKSIRTNTGAYRATQSIANWTLRVPSKAIHTDDLVCLVQGALKPTIIRRCSYFFEIIVLRVNPLGDETTLKRLELCPLTMNAKHKLSLTWYLEGSQQPRHKPSEYNSLEQ